MSRQESGIYVGSKIPQILREAIIDAVNRGNYLNSSDFIRDAIKEKLQREHLLIERSTSTENIAGDQNIFLPETKYLENNVCGKNGCYESAVKRILFPLGFSALFCEKCASELVKDESDSFSLHNSK